MTGLLATEGGDGGPPEVERTTGGDLFPPPQPTNSSDRARKSVRESWAPLFLTAPLFYYLSVAFLDLLARIMHKFSSRSDESDDLTRRATGGRRKRIHCSTLSRPTECNAVRVDDFVGAAENL